ncbi:MAG: hypothetical protein KAG53_11945 [Endozoicomonadaceae bacterium]|nr:hypothetical protein [Endozoicomonadaceae bacterium]
MSINSTSAASVKSIDNQTANESDSADVDSKDSADFEKIMSGDKNKKKALKDTNKKEVEQKNIKKQTAEHKAKQEKAKSNSPEDLVRLFHNDRGQSGQIAKGPEISSAKTAEVQSVSTQETIDKIEKIVDRIQIQTAGDVKSVNIKLNNNILPGTEVMFLRENGKIKITFTTTSAESLNFLSKGEQSLAETLNKKFGDSVTVNIQRQNNDNPDQDGRSRNQYVGDDPSEDDAEQ